MSPTASVRAAPAAVRGPARPDASGGARVVARRAVRAAIRRAVLGLAVGTIGAVLAGCAATQPAASSDAAPRLRLAPSLLGHPLDLQQHITVVAPGHEQQIDVLLEADASHVQLGVVAMGQVAARLEWNGTTLTEHKAPWWPAAVSGSRILSDLQLSLWPVAAIRAALPPGWQLAEADGVRTLSQDGAAVTVITHPTADVVEVEQRREHFHLKIVSTDMAAAAPASAPEPVPVPVPARP